MKLERVNLRQIRTPLPDFVETIILVEAIADGVSGWGEVTAHEGASHNEEWSESAWLILKNYAAQRLLGRDLAAAPAGLEAALWDLEARLEGVPLWRKIGGGARTEIPCGVSIGFQDSVARLLEKIEAELAAGYQRVRIRIKPGWDVDVVRQARERFPSARLIADCGSAYTPRDTDRLKELDAFYLMMIEQPLAHDDFSGHAALQAKLETPVCLGESIRTAQDAEQALQLRACQIININLGRVGGFTEAKRVHDIAQAGGAPVWCGGVPETGIGRAHNVALASLPNFVLPADIPASRCASARDIVIPAVEVTPRGSIALREQPGFGYELDYEYIRHITVREETVV